MDTPTWGCARAGTVEAWIKRVKHVGNEEETSEGASNDAVVGSLGRSVGGHPPKGRARARTEAIECPASGARRENDGGVGEASKARRELGGNLRGRE